MSDVIAAIATPHGMGAVSLIRVSGEGCFERLMPALPLKAAPQARRAVLTHVLDASGEAIDEVLLTYFPGPASYTGEDTIEVTGHGGVLVTRRVLERFYECGVSAAKEGEFSERSFLNGKLDLAQAEAVMDLISATSDLAIRSAREQLSGGLSEQIQEMRQTLIGVLAELEAYIDFPEEDISPETGAAFLSRMTKARDAVSALLETEDQGRMIREGIRTVICGHPNAGKSRLLNRLLGFDRAIVSDIEGTTRDTVEELIHIGGVPVRLIDTAGLRESEDAIEKQGIERSEQQIAGADLVLQVVDGTQPAPEMIELVDQKHLLVINKSDLGIHESYAPDQGVIISCETGEGLDDLAASLSEVISENSAEWTAAPVAINARHRDCLKRAEDSLVAALEQLASGLDAEFVAVDLREALEAIGEVTGKVDTEEVLGEIFGKFCIGK